MEDWCLKDYTRLGNFTFSGPGVHNNRFYNVWTVLFFKLKYLKYSENFNINIFYIDMKWPSKARG